MEVKKYEKIILDSSRSIDDIVASVKAELSKQESKNAGESYICYVSHAYSSGDNAGANYIVVSDGFKELKRLSSNVIQISAYNKDEINELIATNISTKANANSVVNLTDNQTIEGVKTFSSVPVSATNPTANNQVANKAYVDTVGNTAVKLTGNQAIAGTKTFSSPVVVPNGTANNHAVNLAQLNTKANANATVNLTGDQSIAGVKTFTSNITAPNITTLQNQMNGLVSGGKSPYLLHDGQVTARIGDYDGEFRNFTDALKYLKQNGSKSLNSNITLDLGYTDFNDNITLSDLPPMTINCSFRKLGNNLHIKNCPNIYIIRLKLSGTLTVENSNVFLGDYFDTRKIVAKKNSLITLGSHSNTDSNTNIFSVEAYNSKIIFEGSFVTLKSDNGPCIIADDNSTITLGSFLDFYPANQHAAIASKFGSQIILKGKFYKQYRGRYFAWVDSGGQIIGNNDLGLEIRNITRTNIAPNTWSYNGMILGNGWR